MSSTITKNLFKLILTTAFLALGAGTPAGAQEEHHSHGSHESHEQKKDAPVAAHCEDASARAEEKPKELRPLAALGNARAQYELGFMYERGNGVPQDYKEAASWYRKAAEQGNAPAQFYLGQMYDVGKGVPQGYEEAASWYRKAAEQGEALAQLYLGFLYAHGQGVPVDRVQAYKWYAIAATSGNDMAVQTKRNAESEMIPTELKEAQALADEWSAQHKMMHSMMKH